MLLEAADLLLDLPDALVQLRLLTRARGAAQLEQPSLSRQDPQDGRVGRARREVLREDQPLCVVALRFEPGLSRRELVQALDDDREVGARDRLIQAHEQVAGLDLIPVAHEQFADNTAGWVLHLLDVRIDHETARGDHRAGDFGRAGPAADSAGQDDGDPEAEAEVAAERRPRAPC